MNLYSPHCHFTFPSIVKLFVPSKVEVMEKTYRIVNFFLFSLSFVCVKIAFLVFLDMDTCSEVGIGY